MTLLLSGILGRTRPMNSSVAVKKAFPTAEGFGRFAGVGGQLRTIAIVSNLNDSGSGSLREACSQPNRDVIFKVSGNIQLQSLIQIDHAGNIFIHGHTAIGGIMITPVDANTINSAIFRGNASNIVIRHVRFRRKGETPGLNAGLLSMLSGNGVIIDHVSVSHASDDLLGGMLNGGSNFTVQNTMFYEPVPKPGSNGEDDQTGINTKGTLFYNNLQTLSLLNNLWSCCGQRNPAIRTLNVPMQVEMINNVIFNRDGFGTSFSCAVDPDVAHPNAQIDVNFIGNLFIEGDDIIDTRYDLTVKDNVNLYIADSFGNFRENATIDQYAMVGDHSTIGAAAPASHQVNTPFVMAYDTDKIVNSANLESHIELNVGPNLPMDSEDARIITEWKNRTGRVINAPTNAFTYPTLSGTQYVDTTNNGMSDAFETEHSVTDGAATKTDWDFNGTLFANEEGYTNFEVFSAWLAGDFN